MMPALDTRIPPPLLMLGIGALMTVPLLEQSHANLPVAWRWGLAAAFFVAAGLFGLPAFAAFRRARTTIDPVSVDRATSLVTTGIYRFTRNPMYVALCLLLCAWSAWLARPLACIGPVAFIAFITWFQIMPEERVLSAKFGESYVAYRRSVRRWL